ncbi:hypothetical protein KSP39_PZI010677 [Platanthera zijinensis]|uniref:Uncharacterized protein n=1 Tax=Platanthera zijinensis TaxID=2320716 RepID=A0AAP0BIS1_9ASPA
MHSQSPPIANRLPRLLFLTFSMPPPQPARPPCARSYARSYACKPLPPRLLFLTFSMPPPQPARPPYARSYARKPLPTTSCSFSSILGCLSYFPWPPPWADSFLWTPSYIRLFDRSVSRTLTVNKDGLDSTMTLPLLGGQRECALLWTPTHTKNGLPCVSK